MQVDPVTSLPPQQTGNAAVQDAATNAFGLSFESLLRIILTQLTYQDPLKPMDNFEFVSQLAQFSQLQIGQTANDRLQMLVSAQGNSQAASLLGRVVNLATTGQPITGKVTAITFAEGEPRVTINTGGTNEISNIRLGSITRILEGD